MAALALVSLGGAAAAQVSLPSDNTAYGTTSAEFLLLGAGARGLALGGAYAALSNDVSALYYNPAGLTLMEHPAAMVSSYSYVASTKYTWAGMAFPMGGGARAFGFQVGSLGFSGQPVYTVDQPDGTGTTYSVAETFVGGTFSQNFSDRFSAGITAKYISDQLGAVKGSAFAFDFGTNFHVTTAGRPLRASFVIQNLGSTLAYSGVPLDTKENRSHVPGQVAVRQEPQPVSRQTKEYGWPVMFRVGIALDALSTQQARFTVLSEFSQPNNNKAGFELGGELTLSDIAKSGFYLSGRGSWSYQPANNIDVGSQAGFTTALSGKENQEGLAAGMGVGYRRSAFGLGFDYAWRSMGPLGGTNFLSFSVAW
jgi:hypothetical protein